MDELERLQAALIAAHNAGDTAAASALAVIIRQRMQAGEQGLAQPNTAQEPAGGVAVNSEAAADLADNVQALGTGARNGMTFGFFDELAGLGMGAAGATMRPDGTFAFDTSVPFSDRYSSMAGLYRDINQQASETAPGPYAAGNILGGAATSALALPETAGASALGTLGRMLGVGALEGGLLGAGYADGENVGEQAAWGAGLGAVTGLLAPAVVSAARAVGRPIGGLLGIGNATRAGTKLARVLDRAGMDVPEVQSAIYQAHFDGQPMFVTADALGTPGQRALAGVARSPGEGRTEIVQFLQDRQRDQRNRVGTFLQEALDTPDTAAQRTAALESLRDENWTRNDAAAVAAAGFVDVSPVLGQIDAILRRNPLIGESSLARTELGNRLTALRDQMANSNEMLTDYSTIRNLRTDMRYMMETNPRAAAEMRPVYNAMTDALSAASEGFRLANDTYAADSRVIDAVGQGIDAARPRRLEDVIQTFEGLTPEAQAAFRSGYADPAMTRIQNIRPTRNAAADFQDLKDEGLIPVMATNPELWQRRIQRENDMFGTYDAALLGSRTADNTADQADMSETPLDLGMIVNALQGRFGLAAQQAGQKAINGLVGANEQTRNMIARALLSPDPQAALEPLLREAMLVRGTNTAAEALMRQSAFQGLLAN